MKQGFSTLLFLLFIGALAALGYFSWKNLSHPAQYINQKNETIGDLHQLPSENISDDTSTDSRETQTPSGDALGTTAVTSDTSSNNATNTNTNTNTNNPVSSSSVATLLQDLLRNKTVLKIGSQGPSVGALQKIMNAYFTKNLKIDNDFGKTLETDIKKFQTQNKVSPTGQVGPQTLQKLIDWVGKHPDL